MMRLWTQRLDLKTFSLQDELLAVLSSIETPRCQASQNLSDVVIDSLPRASSDYQTTSSMGELLALIWDMQCTQPDG